MCDDAAKDIREAKERLVALFGDLETYMEFMMKRQEKRIKRGVKYADFSPYRKKKQEKPGPEAYPVFVSRHIFCLAMHNRILHSRLTRFLNRTASTATAPTAPILSNSSFKTAGS